MIVFYKIPSIWTALKHHVLFFPSRTHPIMMPSALSTKICPLKEKI